MTNTNVDLAPKKSLGDRMFGQVQKLGKAIMLPVSVLPVAGILLGVGGALLNGNETNGWNLPEWAVLIFTIMRDAGDPIFGALPLLFAIGIALGFTKNDGVSALAASVGFLVMTSTIGVMGTYLGAIDPEKPSKMLGLTTMNTGVFGGIIIGLIAAYLFNKYYRISLPPYLGFFAGKRFVPIVTAFAAIVVGAILSFIWPPIQNGINTFGQWASQENPLVATWLYGTVERALLPFGLHHIWNSPFFFEIGDCIKNGQPAHGIITCFFAGEQEVGILGGGFLFKMFGLPGAGLAIAHTARPENRARVSSIMLSAAFTSFLTGITEPLEFSFLFVAPVLYGAHVVMAGIAFPIVLLLNGRFGYTFSQGFIDYALYFALDRNQWIVPVVGLVYFGLYYVVFRFLIQALDLKTPGREVDDVEVDTAAIDGGSMDFARQLVLAFGGRSNITDLDACITRLRVGVKDISKANQARLKALGAAGVLLVGNNMQAIYGPRAENLKVDMEEYLKIAGDEAELSEADVPDVTYETKGVEPKLRDPLGPEKAASYLSALGGASNIVKVEAAAETRLRVRVKDTAVASDEALAAAGVNGVARIGADVLHLIVGLNADQYATEMRAQMAGAVSEDATIRRS